MIIQLNGSEHELPDGATVADLIKQLDFEGRRVALELNLEIVPRSTFDTVLLQPHDRVELVQAIGGG